MWIYLALSSAIFLGFYDITKKHSLRDNSVIQVLFLSNVAGMALVAPLTAVTIIHPEWFRFFNFRFQFIGPLEHGLIFIKSLIVTISWIFAWNGLKHLPISIAAPIRSSGPFWTMLVAISFFGEMPDKVQWLALMIILFSYYYFSLVGLREGIVFHKNKWVIYTFAATILGTSSSLYDKHLLQKSGFEPLTMQFWFTFYCMVIMGLVSMIYKISGKSQSVFKWKWGIPLIGFLLIIADFLYFSALKQNGSLVTLVSAVRRSSVLISFVAGGLIFRDLNKRKKSVAVAGIVAGILILVLK